VQLAGGVRTKVSETDFRVFSRPHFAALKAKQGRGLYVLSGSTSSPSGADMKARWQAYYPEARWYEYEPVSSPNERLGSQLAFGAPFKTVLRLDRARVILSLDADFLAARTDSLVLARDWARGRQPESGQMNRLYVFESSLSETGAVADHRYSLRSEHIKALAAHLEGERSAAGAGGEVSRRPCLAQARQRRDR
jgi:molybdopterin-containing oxidoreductase family iron-sulfur binding subunit